jgi:glycosyltransferase involved in cell wall biosynthesis
VLPNYLADHYYGIEHVDSPDLGWAGVMWSHPNDPQVVGPAVARLVREGATFSIVGNPVDSGRAFALEDDPAGTGLVDLMDWPREVAKIGIGLTPLADTAFNVAKSWLKPLEKAAVGVPWVGSPRPEYVRLHRLGCGLLAARPKDWYRQLKRLRDEPALRLELSEAGRGVADELRLRDHAEKWVEAWLDALGIQRGVHAAAAR